MISALIAWGIGFGGVNYIATHGLLPGAPPATMSLVETRTGMLDARHITARRNAQQITAAGDARHITSETD